MKTIIRRSLDHWKASLLRVKRILGLAEPELLLPQDADRDQIGSLVDAYVRRSIRWQTKQRERIARSRAEEELFQKFGTRWLGLTQFRAPIVLLSFFVALFAAGFVWLSISNHKDFPIQDWQKPNTVLSALLPLLLASPIAFWIWVFRDQNAQRQIDNQRKDINLKDFQKLCEWASGLHLNEDKNVESRKTLEKRSGGSSPSERGNEVLHTVETSVAPNRSSGVSRRIGGESLQVAAIYQLQAFLAGEFGVHFERPTFQLYKSLWQGLVAPATEELDDSLVQYFINDSSGIDREALTKELNKKGGEIHRQAHSPLGLALIQAFSANRGERLARHGPDLPGSQFAGIDTSQSGLEPLELAGFNLSGIRLQRASLWHAKLQGAKLSSAQLQLASLRYVSAQGANFFFAELQKATLAEARLQGANFRLARLYECDLEAAQLQGADFSSARLLWVKLKRANLRQALLRNAKMNEINLQEASLNCADLKFAELRGADLSNTTLFGADLRGIELDEKINLNGARYDHSTRFGRLRPSGSRLNDADFIDAAGEESKWRDRGARRADELPLELN